MTGYFYPHLITGAGAFCFPIPQRHTQWGDTGQRFWRSKDLTGHPPIS